MATYSSTGHCVKSEEGNRVVSQWIHLGRVTYHRPQVTIQAGAIRPPSTPVKVGDPVLRCMSRGSP